MEWILIAFTLGIVVGVAGLWEAEEKGYVDPPEADQR